MPTVLLTGANGFLAQAILKELLAKKYTVIGVVRTFDKGETLKEYTDNDPNLVIEIIPSYDKEGAFDELFHTYPDIESVLHTASPLVLASVDPVKDIINPAIYSTRYLLKSISKHAPNLKHFVYTSSFAAQASRFVNISNETLITEETWNPVTLELVKEHPLLGYPASKTFAEKEVWNFVDNSKPSFTVTTILPAAVLGPQAFDKSVLDDSNRSTSAMIVRTAKGDRYFPSENITHIDIRDVVQAHILAIQSAKYDRKRLSLANEATSFTEISRRVHEKYPKEFGKFPHVEGKPVPDLPFDNSKTRQILDAKWHSLDESITATIDQLSKLGKL